MDYCAKLFFSYFFKSIFSEVFFQILIMNVWLFSGDFVVQHHPFGSKVYDDKIFVSVYYR